MEFGREKCSILIIKNGNRQITERIKKLNKESIRTLGDKGNNKDQRCNGYRRRKWTLRHEFKS